VCGANKGNRHMRFVHKNIVTEGNQKYQEAWDAIALLEYDREFHEQLIGIEMMEARERAKKEWAETTMKRPAANATMPSAGDMVQFGDAAVDFAAMIADVDNMQMGNEDIVMLESNSDDEVWDIWVVNKNLGGHDTTEISEKKEENEDNSMLKLDTCENVLKRVIDDAEKFPGKRLCEGLDIDAA